MLLKSEIEDVFNAQQLVLKKDLMTSRNYLVEHTFNGKQVEVISGIRRSGKSTLIDLLVGLLHPDAGNILIDGKQLNTIVSPWQKLIGYVPQSNGT